MPQRQLYSSSPILLLLYTIFFFFLRSAVVAIATFSGRVVRACKSRIFPLLFYSAVLVITYIFWSVLFHRLYVYLCIKRQKKKITLYYSTIIVLPRGRPELLFYCALESTRGGGGVEYRIGCGNRRLIFKSRLTSKDSKFPDKLIVLSIDQC